MSCEGENLGEMSQEALGEAYRFHVLSPVLRGQTEEIGRVVEIQRVYEKRFGNPALVILVTDAFRRIGEQYNEQR